MALPDPCEGESAGFHMLPAESYQGTLGDPEKIIWNSIRHMCVREVAHSILADTHMILSKKLRQQIIPNIKVYITQASKFYDAAQHATTDTAPLLYYYSFLNLAKVLCEIRQPRFHKRPESYRHGLSWKPSPNFLVYMERETVYATTRGVWHVLLEALEGQPSRVPSPVAFRIKDLFALCPNTTVEYEATYHQPTRLIELIDPDILFEPKSSELWIRFSVSKSNLKSLRLSRRKLLGLLTYENSLYRQVKSRDKYHWTFELERAKKIDLKDISNMCIPPKYIENEIKAMNLFANISFDEICYSIPLQDRLPMRLPQIVVLYTLMFWLSSLVRYDPHSIGDLEDSRYWILIDGFLSQSRIWLLELFDWHFYKADTTLRSLR